jgi:hypothetical protein
MSYFRDTDFFLSLSKGEIANHSDYSAFGINQDVDTGTPEDIWLNGGTFTPPTTYRVHNIASASANDTSAGTGARTVKVYGVVSTGLAEETITMNGTSNVATVNSYSDIYRMYILTAGSGETNAGAITATAVTDATVTCTIPTGGLNTCRKCIRLIPPGYTGYIYDFQAGMSQATASSFADVYLMTKESGGVWLSRRYHSLNNSGSSVEFDEFKVPLKLTEGTWVKVRCTSVTNNNTLVQAAINLILVKN